MHCKLTWKITILFCNFFKLYMFNVKSSDEFMFNQLRDESWFYSTSLVQRHLKWVHTGNMYLSGVGSISPSLSPHKSFSVSLSQILMLLIQLDPVCSLTHNLMSTLKISPLLPCQVPSDLYLGWMSFDRAHIYTVKGIVHQLWKLIIMSSKTLFYLSSIEIK